MTGLEILVLYISILSLLAGVFLILDITGLD